MKRVGHWVMHEYESLQLARRFETTHDPLPHARRLVGILRAIVESFVLAVLKLSGNRKYCQTA
jgi:hypothetical protein